MIGFSHAPGGYVDHIGVYAGTDAAGTRSWCMHPMWEALSKRRARYTVLAGYDVIANSPDGVRWTQVCTRWGMITV